MKASITIYLSLVLVVILALIFALMESGRVSAIRARARSAAFMAADSAFAEFAQPVFDRYGVMFLWEEEEEFRKNFDQYLQNTLDLSGSGAGYDLDLYGLRYRGSEMKGAERIADDGGAPFARQVYDYMKVHAAEGLAESLLSRSKVFQQSEKTREIFGKINAYQEDFAKVEEDAVRVYEATQRIKDLSENPRSVLEELETAFEDPDEAKQALSREKKEWQKTEKQLQKEVDALTDSSKSYQKHVSGAREASEEMQTELQLKEEDFDPDIYRAIQEKVQSLAELGSGEGAQFREIAANTQTASEWLQTAKQMDTYFEEAEAALERNEAEAGRELTRAYQEAIEAPEFSLTKAEKPVSSEKKAVGTFIRKINQESKKGLLDFFADEISEKEIEKTELPSETVSTEDPEKESEGVAEKTLQKALFCEYIREHCNCFTSQNRETALDYEMEYILFGKASDRKNLSAAAAELVLLRSGANMLSLLMDSKKMAEIEELAAAIAAASTQVYVAKIAEVVILTAWSVAEAMLDVRALLSGKKVPVLKREADWNFSLQGLQNFSGEETPEKDSAQGLSYSEYLLILLLLEGQEKQILRTMDVIQINMCQEETPRFRIRDALVGVQVQADFTAPVVFPALLPQEAGHEQGGYAFSFLQEYAYSE